jgi:hypothetical protein
MAQEYAFDRLARVFDNATENYVGEQQRQRRLADERAYAERQLANQRAYADTTRDTGWAHDDAVRKQGITDDTARRVQVRGENRDDATWASQQAVIAGLINERLITPEDAQDPAKVAAAINSASPAAKVRIADHKQAIDEIGKLTREFGTLGVAEAGHPETLDSATAFTTVGLLRQKVAEVKQRFGTKAAGIMGEIQSAMAEHQGLVNMIEPSVTPEDRRAAENNLGADASKPGSEMLIEPAAEKIATARAYGAKSRAQALAVRISALQSQLNGLDNMSKAGVWLPEATATQSPAAPPPPPKIETVTGNPLDNFLAGKGAPVAGSVGELPKPTPAPGAPAIATPWDDQIAEEARKAEIERGVTAQRDAISGNMAELKGVSTLAAQTNEQLERITKGVNAPPTGMGRLINPFGAAFAHPQRPDELAGQYRDRVTARDAAVAKRDDLVRGLFEVANNMTPEQQDQVRKMAGIPYAMPAAPASAMPDSLAKLSAGLQSPSSSGVAAEAPATVPDPVARMMAAILQSSSVQFPYRVQ